LGKPEPVQRKRKEQNSGGRLTGRAELSSFGSSKVLGQLSRSDFGGMFNEFLSAHLVSILSLNVQNSLLQN